MTAEIAASILQDELQDDFKTNFNLPAARIASGSCSSIALDIEEGAGNAG